MEIDKEKYRQARQWYREWDEAKLIDRARNAGKLTPQQGWEQFIGLWEFCQNLAPPPSEQQRKRRLADLEQYYARMYRFETWRKDRGETT